MSVEAGERRQRIIAHTRDRGRVEVSDLAQRLGVSHETVRRDLTKLERSGMIRRTHGAAYPIDNAGFESTLDLRSNQLIREKQRIAEAAFDLIGDATTIHVDEGFTSLLVAERVVKSQRPMTVVTPSLPAGTLLAGSDPVTVIMLGGELRRPTLGTIGHWVSEMISTLVIDEALLGANGISIARGLTTPNPAVSEIKGTVVARTRRRMFVGDHTKFGVETFSRFAEVRHFEALVTDSGLTAYAARRYSAPGPLVHRV
ncbi:DeoR/GlpR family transcriptional regulator of sugar metabolism [Nakamurella sp. UYEF19]|uniref:DeoR/GlpR family DNA-binding transcription regulator n=1 Tax=Nakamurella sp. UYEF19 TaxID=1756392 RepID=UPI003395DFB5